MELKELIAWASPPCHICGEPIIRVQHSWVLQGEDYVPKEFTMICVKGHRVAVKQFE